MRWYRGDLQSHTHHSDGKGSLATLVATARARALDFLAVTDHNTISHIRELDLTPSDSPSPDDDTDVVRRGGRGVRPLLIPGEEVTTYYGHMNVWGVRQWIDFRCRDVNTMNQIIAAAHQQGCLASVNHPKQGGPPWEYGSALDFDCIEVWQGPWPFHNQESFSWWESLLKQGRRVVAVGGSDYHQPVNVMQGNPHLLGHPTTWVYAEELSVSAILAAIRRGHVFISADVDGPQIRLDASDARHTSRVGHASSVPRTRPAACPAWGTRAACPAPALRRVRRGTCATRHTYMMGDVIADANAGVDVTCRVQGAAGYYARLIGDGQIVDERAIESADWTHTWHMIRADQYIRAEAIIRHAGSGDWVMAACTNPIYFRGRS